MKPSAVVDRLNVFEKHHPLVPQRSDLFIEVAIREQSGLALAFNDVLGTQSWYYRPPTFIVKSPK
jgi:hypothetical protein